MPGGQIKKTEIIENYPGFKENISGYELSLRLLEHCEQFGIKIRNSFSINSIEYISDEASANKSAAYSFRCQGNGGVILANSVIMATGAYPDRLNVDGEEEFIGRGISFCATCDGALFAKKVYVIHRRDELRADKILRDRAFENKKIKFLWSSTIEKFTGSDRLEEVLIRDKKENKTYKLKVNAVFEYVGWKPNSGLVKDLVELDEKGFIITNSRMETSMPGIFAAGDVRNTPLRQVITAVADGAIASVYADRFLHSITRL
jgi:thioredoxin reductase (NADPH)